MLSVPETKFLLKCLTCGTPSCSKALTLPLCGAAVQWAVLEGHTPAQFLGRCAGLRHSMVSHMVAMECWRHAFKIHHLEIHLSLANMGKVAPACSATSQLIIQVCFCSGMARATIPQRLGGPSSHTSLQCASPLQPLPGRDVCITSCFQDNNLSSSGPVLICCAADVSTARNNCMHFAAPITRKKEVSPL